jgi:hypothetical protein
MVGEGNKHRKAIGIKKIEHSYASAIMGTGSLYLSTVQCQKIATFLARYRLQPCV